MQKIINKIVDFFNRVWAKEWVKAFCYIFGLGMLCFSLRAAFNKFTMPMSGDYVLQSYAFYAQGYEVFWNFIKTGEYPLFDFSNYLGANYLGTQSFYYVYSPLFYLLCLCPKKFLYQGIFVHLVFKFALGGSFMFVLLRKYFHVSFRFSWIGGFIYAFSGWSLFYVWFHFGDVMAFFPLFIMGIERVLKERKGGLLALGTFLCGLSCYFFLVNFLIFGILYAFYRWIHIYGINKKRGFSFKERWGVLIQGILYCLAGVFLAGICLFPSLHVATATNRTQTSSEYLLQLLSAFFAEPQRTDGALVLGEFKAFKEIFASENLKELFNTLFVWSDRKIGTMEVPANVNYGYILSNWIYMNTNCWDNVLFDNPSLDNSIGGMFITTPLTLLLIPSIVNAFKTKRPWTIFGVILCLALPFFPITFHSAFAFTSLYGRWQLWIVMIGIIFIIPTLDRFEKVNRRWITVNLLLNYTFAVIVYMIAKNSGKLPTSYIFNVFGLEIPGLILITIAELVVMFIVWLIYRFKVFKPAMVKSIMMVVIILEIAASTVCTLEQKGYYKWDEYYLSQPQFEELSDVIDEIQEEDTNSFYRIMNTEATRTTMNLPSTLNYKGASSFNSTYDFDLDVFKNRSRMAYGGGWTMGNHEKRYWLDQYISTKYYVIDKKDPNNDNAEYYRDRTGPYDGRTSMDEAQQEYRLNLPWNYELYKSYEYHDVYINNQAIGIGYTVDNFITSTAAGTGKNASFYEELYATTAIIENEDAEYIYANSPKTNYISKYAQKYNTFSKTKWDLYFSPREDASEFLTGNRTRQTYKLEDSTFTKKEISKYLSPKSQFLHRRWEGNNYFGDQFILKLKEGNVKLAANATEDNLCYINFAFKLGPKVLISFYNGDTLVTQDAHSHANSSLNNENYEWKFQRGFYLNQPVDKIVIEFISDTAYEKLFAGTSLGSAMLNITYAYQNDIEEMQEVVNENKFTEVHYSKNKFTFKGNSTENKIAVTTIPYDAGWTLTAKGREIDIIKVNGGFVGFITPTGETTYTLKYFTPRLKEGLVSTGIGMLMLLALYFVYKNKSSSILLCERQIEAVYLTDLQQREDKYYKEVDAKVKQFIEKIKKKIKKDS